MTRVIEGKIEMLTCDTRSPDGWLDYLLTQDRETQLRLAQSATAVMDDTFRGQACSNSHHEQRLDDLAERVRAAREAIHELRAVLPSMSEPGREAAAGVLDRLSQALRC